MRKTISLIVGLPIVIVGLILIPLPGPGVLVTIVGLLVLSWGFDSIKSYLETYKQKLVMIYRKAKRKHDDFLEKHGIK